jgi:hypothetical protein
MTVCCTQYGLMSYMMVSRLVMHDDLLWGTMSSQCYSSVKRLASIVLCTKMPATKH